MNENKILIDSSLFYIESDGIYYINIYSSLDLHIKENIHAKLVILNENSDFNINIYLKENSNLIVNSLTKDVNLNVDIILENNSEIIYNNSVVGKR